MTDVNCWADLQRLECLFLQELVIVVVECFKLLLLEIRLYVHCIGSWCFILPISSLLLVQLSLNMLKLGIERLDVILLHVEIAFQY